MLTTSIGEGRVHTYRDTCQVFTFPVPSQFPTPISIITRFAIYPLTPLFYGAFSAAITCEADNDWYGVNDRLSFGPRDLSLASMRRLSSLAEQVGAGGGEMTAEVTFQVGVISANAYLPRERCVLSAFNVGEGESVGHSQV